MNLIKIDNFMRENVAFPLIFLVTEFGVGTCHCSELGAVVN